MNQEQLQWVINQIIRKDWIDIVGIFTPLFLSTIAIIITIYATVLLPKKRRFTVSLYWDDLMCRFVVIIINQGNSSIVIDKVRLFIKTDNGEKKLGERKCVCSINGKVIIIEPQKAWSFTPIKGSLYDLFAYKGHYFDVTDTIKENRVYIEAVDIKGKRYWEKTKFTLAEIDEKIPYQNEEMLDEI